MEIGLRKGDSRLLRDGLKGKGRETAWLSDEKGNLRHVCCLKKVGC